MTQFTNLNSFFDWFLAMFDTHIFGMVGISALLILVLIFSLLVFINANRFTTIGWISVTMMTMGLMAYTFFSWIGVLGAILAGLLLFIAIVRLIGL